MLAAVLEPDGARATLWTTPTDRAYLATAHADVDTSGDVSDDDALASPS